MSTTARALAHLQDVFPSIPASAVSAALCGADGDSDQAAAALLEYSSGPGDVPRQVTVDSLCQSPNPDCASFCSSLSLKDSAM